MLLAIDIGNTNIALGVFDSKDLKGVVRFSTRSRLTIDECHLIAASALREIGVEETEIKAVVIASVVPALTAPFQQMSTKFLGCTPLTVSHKVRLPVSIQVDQPQQVGADRIANAAAAYTRFGGPVIVVDFGTATTFDVVNANGAYIGGVIAPGPETAMAELARKAAQLFEIQIEPPATVVGRNTTEALKSGLFHGAIGQVDYIVDKILAESGFRDCTVIATGGLAGGFEKHSRHISRVEPSLTLEGLRLIADANS
ncbi:MAG: type III pantothenate kinase [Candidatus Zixiibacteriota bacterium]